MNDQIWYVYHGGQQLGPFATSQITQMIDTKMISHEAYLFKVGWKDWRPIEDTYEDLGLAFPAKAPALDIEDRRETAPRATIRGRVIVHNNGNHSIGEGVDISETGMFVETEKEIFTVGERLKVSVRAEGLDKPFNAEAHVIRYNSDPRFPVGYGIKFEDLGHQTGADIRRLVEEENEKNEKAANS